ncbi:unnamed protein product [Spodoptera littoralis]|uniref:Uncharacterized protein n=2 Tax=Spodoptera littoralis TaxID=7109 RepID=A0A9P0NBB9_SPOLI|nr:unnamed protein product [Spodoptera littoralis]CAH1646647.1 unnamed protein product [Spodoptera littoralis]
MGRRKGKGGKKAAPSPVESSSTPQPGPSGTRPGSKNPPTAGADPKSPPAARPGPKSPPAAGPGPKSPPAAGPGPKSPPAAGPGPKSPPAAGPGPKSPPAAGPGPRSLSIEGLSLKSPPAERSGLQIRSAAGPGPKSFATTGPGLKCPPAERSGLQSPSAAGPNPLKPPTSIQSPVCPGPAEVEGPSLQASKAEHRAAPAVREQHPGKKQTAGTESGSDSRPTNVLRTRPDHIETKKGDEGTAISIKANYFTVETTPRWCLYQYHVDFSPDEDSTAVRKGLMRVHAKTFGGYLFDGSVLYTVKRLHPDPLELVSIRSNDEQRVRILIKLTCDVAPGDYHYIQIFNIIIRKCFQILNLQLMGRDYFDSEAKIEIPEYRLQIWPGYKTTINQYEDRLLMVTEITHKVLRVDTVLHMLNEYADKKGSNFRKIFLEDVVGKIVMTVYNKKTYKIDDIAWQTTPKCTFKIRDENITYVEYYKKKYNITIRDLQQPLLISRSKPRDIRAGMPALVYLVPELCQQTGLTDEMRNNFKLMKALDTYTKVGPDVRIQKLLQFNKRLSQSPEVVKEMTQWSLTLSKNLVNFKTRQLPTETIIQGANIKYLAGDTADGWTRNIRSTPLLAIAQIPSWVVITPDKLRRETDGFIELIIKSALSMGLRMPRPEFMLITYDTAIEYANTCETAIARKNPAMILCVLTRKVVDRYEAIKKKCSVDRAVPTQVVCARNMSANSAMSIATKIAIQINCKLGGAPWRVDIPLQSFQIIGYDVCHDTRSKEKSFGGFVASLNTSLTQFYSAVNSHSSGEELSNHMSFNIGTAVTKYRIKNGELPTRILIYRDGVGDGQIPYVYTHEVEQIKKKLAEIYGGSSYKLIFIVVSKRINTRIFLDRGLGENPRPGTVVDDVITLPERYDFYLVSQNVRNGTISPTSYNILTDTIKWRPSIVQRMTYKLTHMYFNCSAQVRVPAVCQYAHKLAFLAANSLHNQAHYALTETLYFL